MNMRQSLPFLVLQYLHQANPIQEYFTSRDIFNNQEKAREYYTKKLPFDPEKETIRIAAKYGFTEEQWKEVLRHSGSFTFIPTKQMTECNEEIKNLFQGYDHIENPAQLRNYMDSLLYNAVKSKSAKITRIKHNGIWAYKIIKP